MPLSPHVDGEQPRALGGVHAEGHIVLVAQRGDALHRHPDAEHVGGHGAHRQPCLGAYGLAEGVDGAVVVPGGHFGHGVGDAPGLEGL